MSYIVYKHLKQAQTYYTDYTNGSNEDYLEDKIFHNIKICFDKIYDVAKFHRNLYFNLKENWTLLKAHDYGAVLTNISQWLIKADDRYDGETWTEKQPVK